MCVVAYVSGHGFGHSAREVEVLRHLRADIPLIVKTSAAGWFWQSEMTRPFDLVADNFDVGCIQHDSIHIDVSATLAAYQAVEAQNRARFDEESDYLRRVGARVVVSDVPPFPLAVADAVGIPSALICNFTWADIYADFSEAELEFAPFVAQMRRDYARATICLDTSLSLPRRRSRALSRSALSLARDSAPRGITGAAADGRGRAARRADLPGQLGLSTRLPPSGAIYRLAFRFHGSPAAERRELDDAPAWPRLAAPRSGGVGRSGHLQGGLRHCR